MEFKDELARRLKEEFACRLRRAQARRFDNATQAIEALGERFGIRRRTYYSHASPSDPRMPKGADLARYAELFEVSVAYLLSGADAHLYEDQELVVPKEHGDINEDESAPINQASVKGDSKSSHNGEIRLIVKLSAGGVKKLSSEWGDLTKMSGQRLPVPAFIDAGPRAFWYQITEHDQSMVTSDSFSLTPGAIFLVDLDRPIMPGDHVCAYLEGFAEPVIRKYVASRPHSTGASFTLEARNPAYRPIDVPKDGHCRLIGRVIFFANPI